MANVNVLCFYSVLYVASALFVCAVFHFCLCFSSPCSSLKPNAYVMMDIVIIEFF